MDTIRTHCTVYIYKFQLYLYIIYEKFNGRYGVQIMLMGTRVYEFVTVQTETNTLTNSSSMARG